MLLNAAQQGLQQLQEELLQAQQERQSLHEELVQARQEALRARKQLAGNLPGDRHLVSKLTVSAAALQSLVAGVLASVLVLVLVLVERRRGSRALQESYSAVYAIRHLRHLDLMVALQPKRSCAAMHAGDSGCVLVMSMSVPGILS